jgi:hypothetical protein
VYFRNLNIALNTVKEKCGFYYSIKWFLRQSQNQVLVILSHGNVMENREVIWKKHKVFFVWMLKGGLGQLTTLFVVLLLQQQE